MIVPRDDPRRSPDRRPRHASAGRVSAPSTGKRKVIIMALARITRLAAPAGSIAAALALAALVLFGVVVGSGTISQAAGSAAFYAPTLAALGSLIALIIALVSLFVRQSGELGTLGVVGFLAALVGTVLGAGGYWTYVFVVPYVASQAPTLADQSSGSLLVGFVVSFLLMGVGWLLFAVATLRTRVYPRWAVLLLMAGSVVTIVPMPSRTLVLSVAVATLGYTTRRDRAISYPGPACR